MVSPLTISSLGGGGGGGGGGKAQKEGVSTPLQYIDLR